MIAARARGGLIAINHPSDSCLACSWTHPVPLEVSAIEIANGEPVARQQAMTLWDALLREGRRVTAVGESDYHRGAAPLGTPSVRVRAQELSTPAIGPRRRDGQRLDASAGAHRSRRPCARRRGR